MGNSNCKVPGDSEKNLQLEKAKDVGKKNVKKGSNCVVTRPILPPDIIIEILSWLPVEYLPRIQLVCKQWYHLVQDRHFIEKNMSRATAVTYYNELPKIAADHETFQWICACDGLLLKKSNTTRKYQILNCTTKQILELPDPQKGSFGITFSYVPSTFSYKLVSIYSDEAGTSNECCEVLTVGSDSSWRAIEIPNLMDIGKRRERVSIVSTGASVHCFRIFKVGSDVFEEIVSLDLETESFTITKLPKGRYQDRKNVWALDWYGKLALADMVKEGLRVLLLEDYKKHRWDDGKNVVSLAFMKEDGDVKAADLVPLLVEGDSLWFWLEQKKSISYNFRTGIIGNTLQERDGYTIANTLLRQRPSLVKFKGMQPPVKKTPNQQTNQV